MRMTSFHSLNTDSKSSKMNEHSLIHPQSDQSVAMPLLCMRFEILCNVNF